MVVMGVKGRTDFESVLVGSVLRSIKAAGRTLPTGNIILNTFQLVCNFELFQRLKTISRIHKFQREL